MSFLSNVLLRDVIAFFFPLRAHARSHQIWHWTCAIETDSYRCDVLTLLMTSILLAKNAFVAFEEWPHLGRWLSF